MPATLYAVVLWIKSHQGGCHLLLRLPSGFRVQQCSIKSEMALVVLRQRSAGSDLHQERSEEHTAELQSLLRTSHTAVCLKTNRSTTNTITNIIRHTNTNN